MKDNVKLSADQQSRIDTTLARIRSGLAHFSKADLKEPALIFKPEAFDEKHS